MVPRSQPLHGCTDDVPSAVLPCRRTDDADRGQHVHCLEMLAPRESVGELITSRWTGARIDMRGYHARLNDSNTFSIIVEGASAHAHASQRRVLSAHRARSCHGGTRVRAPVR